MRKLVLHYHFFKNAGTSLDTAFKRALKDGEWVTREFPRSLSVPTLSLFRGFLELAHRDDRTRLGLASFPRPDQPIPEEPIAR